MAIPSPSAPIAFRHRHLLTCERLTAAEINSILDLADSAAESNRQAARKRDLLRGRTLINLFFESSTRTQSSFELAAKRLGADVMNMNVSTSSLNKGETLIDTAITLNAMRPDIIVVRHHAAGAVELLSQKVDCSVINAGDGAHQHPTQALLDALTIRRAKGRIAGLTVAICGDILHSRVARSNIQLLQIMGARVRLIANCAPTGRARLQGRSVIDVSATSASAPIGLEASSPHSVTCFLCFFPLSMMSRRSAWCVNMLQACRRDWAAMRTFSSVVALGRMLVIW